MSASLEKKEVKNILIVAITRLGDMLQASPTILGLKNQYPDARITVVIDKQFATICNGIPGIDEAHVMDLGFICRNLGEEKTGIIEAFRYIDKTVKELREKKFDYCLNMSNSAYTALLIKMLNIDDCRGWISDEEGFRMMGDPWAMLFAAFVYHSNRDYNSLNLVDIFRCAADVDQHPLGLKYQAPDGASEAIDDFLKKIGLEADDTPLICIQAGASQGKRQWAPKKFRKVIELLTEQLNARIILTGSESEGPIIDQVLEGVQNPRVVSAAGATSFDELAALLERADILITGDTGPMHLAVAVGTPVVALFLASALCYETGPYSAGSFILQPQISCSPCNPNYPCMRPDCHEQITPEIVSYMTKLRLQTPMGEEGGIEIPRHVADPRSVAVYRTAFDEDNFLKFERMNGYAPRHGEQVGYFESAQSAYRALWKEEFAHIPYKKLARFPDSEEGAREYPEIHASFQGIAKIVDLACAGINCLEQLIAVIKDVYGAPGKLGQIDLQRRLIDQELEGVSLSYPLLGAVIRIFIMEKENIRGDDPLLLASESRELYARLLSRTKRFADLFIHFHEESEVMQ